MKKINKLILILLFSFSNAKATTKPNLLMQSVEKLRLKELEERKDIRDIKSIDELLEKQQKQRQDYTELWKLRRAKQNKPILGLSYGHPEIETERMEFIERTYQKQKLPNENQTENKSSKKGSYFEWAYSFIPGNSLKKK